MKYILSLLFVIPSITYSYGEYVSYSEQIYNQIVRNKPTINKTYAKKLALTIVVESDRVDIDPQLFTAILMQESSYQLSSKNCKTTTVGYEICTDYGISQIHYKTIKLYKFDKTKLTTDLRYSIRAGLKVLSDFRDRYGEKDSGWWERYNTSIPKLRKRYKKRVERYL